MAITEVTIYFSAFSVVVPGDTMTHDWQGGLLHLQVFQAGVKIAEFYGALGYIVKT